VLHCRAADQLGRRFLAEQGGEEPAKGRRQVVGWSGVQALRGLQIVRGGWGAAQGSFENILLGTTYLPEGLMEA